jgi:hypothetical protein
MVRCASRIFSLLACSGHGRQAQPISKLQHPLHYDVLDGFAQFLRPSSSMTPALNSSRGSSQAEFYKHLAAPRTILLLAPRPPLSSVSSASGTTSATSTSPLAHQRPGDSSFLLLESPPDHRLLFIFQRPADEAPRRRRFFPAVYES